MKNLIVFMICFGCVATFAAPSKKVQKRLKTTGSIISIVGKVLSGGKKTAAGTQQPAFRPFYRDGAFIPPVKAPWEAGYKGGVVLTSNHPYLPPVKAPWEAGYKGGVVLTSNHPYLPPVKAPWEAGYKGGSVTSNHPYLPPVKVPWEP